MTDIKYTLSPDGKTVSLEVPANMAVQMLTLYADDITARVGRIMVHCAEDRAMGSEYGEEDLERRIKEAEDQARSFAGHAKEIYDLQGDLSAEVVGAHRANYRRNERSLAAARAGNTTP